VKVKAFHRACDRLCPTTADGFYQLAEQYLGRPTVVRQLGDVTELAWLHKGRVVAWLTLRRDPATGYWYPDLGGR